MSEPDQLIKSGGPNVVDATIAEYGSIDNYGQGDSEKSKTQLVLTESYIIAKIALPVVLSYILQNSIQTGSGFVVGRLEPFELSVAAFSCTHT